MLNALHLSGGLPNISIRSLISRIGLAIALLVAIAMPVSFWCLHLAHVGKELEFKAKLNSDRIARLIFANEELWQYQGIRISELVDLGNAASEKIQQRVYGNSNSLVVEVGDPISSPHTVVTRPIVVRGQTVGRIELDISLWPGIYLTFGVGLLSSLLGFGAFGVLRVLPLSVLDRTLAELETANAAVVASNETLAQKNAELLTFNESLEKLVAERTADASASAEEAREASRVKSAFLASMSHEIRTPMNGVFGMADLLSRTELTSHQQRLVMTINQSARTLLTIINDILDVSRIEAGKMELDIQEFELRECVESAVEILAEDAHKKQIELNLMLPQSLPASVVGDAGRLRQILLNLIGNAVKFTREGEISIRVTDCGERDGKSVLRFAVSDTGIGIDAATQQLLFKPFSQADSSITRRFGGTGLGLSITQHLVRMMDGNLGLESELGKGTTVSFEIALARSSNSNIRKTVCPAAIRDQRVLVVDDRASNREIVCSYLDDCGAQTESACSAEEALVLMRARSAENQPFALVVLDMVLPGSTGLELARRIKAAPEFSDTRLIMITSLSWKADSQAAREAGIGEFLNKPVRRSELLDAVRRCFTKAPATGTLLPVAKATAPLISIRSKGLRVLVAEDNPVNQEVAREYLNALGCIGHIAENGLAAVEAFSNATFDIVLMDCQMPGMDGLAACRKIREIEQERGLVRTPVIAVTANAYESDRAMCLAAEMDDFMSKPFTATQLASVLNIWANRLATDADEDVGPATAGSSSVEGPIAQTLDLKALDEFECLQAGMAARLAELFLSTAPKTVRQIMMAIVEGDHDKIGTAAHGLKSSSATVGAHELARLANKIEAQAKIGEPLPNCLLLAAKLEAEMCAVENALGRTKWLSNKKKAG